MNPAWDPKQCNLNNLEAPWHPGSTQEAPRRHPGGTQETPRGTQRHPGGTQEARDILESECVISYAPAHKSDGGEWFRVHGSDVTITVYCACAQDFAGAGTQKAGRWIPKTEDTPPEHLQQRLFGEYTHIHIHISAYSLFCDIFLILAQLDSPKKVWTFSYWGGCRPPDSPI